MSATYRIIGTDYFRSLNLPMIRGREFTASEEDSPTAPSITIIDERLARRLFGAEDPIGQLVRFGEQTGVTQHDRAPMTIVGVAAPIRDELFDREAGPAIYVPSGRNYRAGMNLHVHAGRAGTESDMLATIRRELRAVDPRLPILQATTMQAFHDKSIALWAVSAGGRLFLVFGVLALLLAVVGLYGVKLYLVSQRTREIGIRMALGARSSDVLSMVLKEGAVLASVGVAIGIGLAAILGRLLSGILYEVKPLDPVVFLTAPVAPGRRRARGDLVPGPTRDPRHAAHGVEIKGTVPFIILGCGDRSWRRGSWPSSSRRDRLSGLGRATWALRRASSPRAPGTPLPTSPACESAT